MRYGKPLVAACFALALLAAPAWAGNGAGLYAPFPVKVRYAKKFVAGLPGGEGLLRKQLRLSSRDLDRGLVVRGTRREPLPDAVAPGAPSRRAGLGVTGPSVLSALGLAAIAAGLGVASLRAHRGRS